MIERMVFGQFKRSSEYIDPYDRTVGPDITLVDRVTVYLAGFEFIEVLQFSFQIIRMSYRFPSQT